LEVGGLRDNCHILLVLQQEPEATSYDGVVIGDHDLDRERRPGPDPALVMGAG
jgi:hypothetical protein